ncbi:SapB/AmfS family lantipeptide [Actinoalloteichus sp. AHMU CJ021]|uniref:Lanthionine-containing peptide SapB n=1 Tax=Actinoalloteichus caeruleus DSM 43889 TaxID=1120930 RepID=A0ABT1JG32_ACTCY|nr:SapB/AmfS family lanthipeptide [Actinoalloteichus caeruleus]AUS77523.1 SapB/AmfS family lantipeptide [Actinoalloteichus sp. AHMU CJ021]MCP2331398.1 hypothetical protein [Actinoalloteichus caeruleus DSM 43889]
MESVLDLQAMEATEDAAEFASPGGSQASLLLCGDSGLSVLTCR